MCILISEKETQNSNTVYVGYMLKKKDRDADSMFKMCSCTGVISF